MPNSTINGLTESTTISPTADFFVSWVGSSNATRKIKAETLDKLMFRQRTATTTAASKSFPVITYSGTTPSVENMTFESLKSSLGVTWVEKTSAYAAVANDRIAADTTATAFTITLPASPALMDSISFCDIGGTWPTKNLTIARNGRMIDGLAEDLICNVSCSFTLVYDGPTRGWIVFA